ncbi:uncharacterized protein BDZ99DRAFT_479924 [Mytilinidion resinicola]|uniref:Uncharacterized protein n=1 Tax=Mytilinidion resinicola TaxID=574789 RepID=A0A6A6YBA3_9PEZI|nr:uncharacterized protein BDZ99DRAFT_479924 [Mytilinidion resinicola]KAF2805899.1 hypothetical protein BDZ99DRAFT_479924 [Mytilinidion resinicola]
MPVPDHILNAIDSFFDDLWREMLPNLQSDDPPFAIEIIKGFKVSKILRYGYTRLAEGDENLWAYKNWDECDQAAHLLCPIVVKVLGVLIAARAEEGDKVEIAHLWVEPERLVKDRTDDRKQRMRGHTVIVYTLKDGRQRVIDPTRSQFGFQNVEKSYREYWEAHAPVIPPQPPQLMTFGGHILMMRRLAARYRSLQQIVFFYHLFAANATLTYNKWAKGRIQGGTRALDVLGGGGTVAKGELLKAMRGSTLRVKEMIDAWEATKKK